MTKTHILISTPAALPPLSRAVFAFARVVLVWEMRSSTRRNLQKLDDHLLRDIGLQRETALAEADKPFWIA